MSYDRPSCSRYRTSRQRNSGYRPSRVNIMAQDLSTPDPSLSPTHRSIRRGRATTTHYTHHQVSLMVSRNTTLVPSLGLRIGPACEAGLSAGMQRERVPPQRRKKWKERKNSSFIVVTYEALDITRVWTIRPNSRKLNPLLSVASFGFGDCIIKPSRLVSQ